MPSEITHKSAFRWGPFFWTLVFVGAGGWVLGANGYAQQYYPPNHMRPCPAVVQSSVPAETP